LKNEIGSLIAGVLAGDESAFSLICSEYEPLLKSMAGRYAHMADAPDEDQVREDLYQEATFALYRAVTTYRENNGEVSFGLYAKICIRNALVSELRKMSRKRKADREQKKDMNASDKSTVSVYDASAVAEIIDNGELSSFEKEVLELYMTGSKVRDIAVVLGRSSKSVSNAIYRIKSKARLYISEN